MTGPGPSETPRPQPKSVLCPYCGGASVDPAACQACGGRFDPLSRQTSQNEMGPWFLRDPAHPFRPGCSFAVLRALIEKGRIGPETVLRGPTTHQFWSLARRTPGVANRLGVCHACQARVTPRDESCPSCDASFEVSPDRQHLGLMTQRHIPGRRTSAEAAGSGASRSAAVTESTAPGPAAGETVARDPDARTVTARAPASMPSEAAEPSELPPPARGSGGGVSAVVAITLAAVFLGGGLAAGWWFFGRTQPEDTARDSGRTAAADSGSTDPIGAPPGEPGDSAESQSPSPSSDATEPDLQREASPESESETELAHDSAESEEPDAGVDWSGLAAAARDAQRLRAWASGLRGRAELGKLREAVGRRAALLDALGSR